MRRCKLTPRQELLKALNATHQARATLELLNRLGVDDDRLAHYERHLREREQAERQILEALSQKKR